MLFTREYLPYLNLKRYPNAFKIQAICHTSRGWLEIFDRGLGGSRLVVTARVGKDQFRSFAGSGAVGNPDEPNKVVKHGVLGKWRKMDHLYDL